MRQIFDINARLENIGDYAFIDIEKDGTTHRVLALRYSDDFWALYSSDNLINGSQDPRDRTVIDRFPFLSIYRGSWVVSCSDNINHGVVCALARENVITSYHIVTDEISLDSEDVQRTESTVDIAEFISDNYERTQMYEGFHGYHYHRSVAMNNPKRPYRGHRIGIELEVEFTTQTNRQIFCDKPSNWFYRESDGSLGSNGCEIISIPLLPIDAKSEDFWKQLTNSITDVATSWNTGRCGLHVHMGREILGKTEEQKSETIGKLLYLYHHYVKDTRLNVKIFGRERGYHDHDGKTVEGDAAKIFGGDVFKIKNASKKVKDAMIDKSSSERYFDINLKNDNTIEFRKGRGSINPKRIAMVVSYCERLCIYAKNTPWQQIGYDDFVAFLRATSDNEFLKEIIDGWS